MGPCSCTNSQLPSYQNLIFNAPGFRYDPIPSLELLNEEITKLNGQNNLVSLLGVIVTIAALAFGSLVTLPISTALAIALLGGVTLIAFQYNQYRDYQADLAKTNVKINNFFQSYGTEFILMHNQQSTYLKFPFSAEDNAIIREYQANFPYFRLLYTTHYKVFGGHTNPIFTTKLVIELICQKTCKDF